MVKARIRCGIDRSTHSVFVGHRLEEFCVYRQRNLVLDVCLQDSVFAAPPDRRRGLRIARTEAPCFQHSYCEQDCSTEIFLSTLLLTPIGPDDLPLIVLAQTAPVLEP